jgi:hypothetical protein
MVTDSMNHVEENLERTLQPLQEHGISDEKCKFILERYVRFWDMMVKLYF